MNNKNIERKKINKKIITLVILFASVFLFSCSKNKYRITKHYNYTIIGDSISDHRRYPLNCKLYMDYIGDETFLSCLNVAKQGEGFVSKAIEIENGGFKDYTHIESAKEIKDDTDAIIIFSSFNDVYNNCVLGDKNSTDVNTVYGSMKETLRILKEHHPNARIGIITPIKWKFLEDKNEYKNAIIKYVNIVKEFAQDNNILLLDLYNDTDTLGFDFDDINNYYGKDGVHVSLKVHRDYLKQKVGKFVYKVLRSW